MTLEEALAIVDELIKPNRLTILKETIFRKCWFNQTYQQIARDSDYDANYIRGVGSRLWQQLSEVCGETVTKHNFHSVLRQLPQTKRKIFNSVNVGLEIPNGTVPLNSDFYIERPLLEQSCYQEISQPGALLIIKSHKKMGKSSLVNHLMTTDKFDYYKVKLDLQQADSNIISNFSKLIRWLIANICSQLSLKNSINCFWNEDLGIKVSSIVYLENCVLKKLDKPLILAIDRLHLVFKYTEVAQEFLSLLHFWYEEARNSSVLQKLRLIVVQSTESYMPININQSLSDVGLTVTLPEFDREQMLDLAQRYQLTQNKNFNENTIEDLRNLIGGHPYLTRLAFYNLAKYDLSLEQLIEEAATETSIYINLLRHYLAILYSNSALASAFKKVISADRSVRLESFLAYQLENLGLISLQRNEAVPVCLLYRLYFKDRLI